MTFYIDKSYILKISSKLNMFKKKSEDAFSCRCPLCGDSKKSKTKSRGNFFKQKDGMFYKCFNCFEFKTTAQMLEILDPPLYKEYCFENFGYNNEHRWHDKKQIDKEVVVAKKQRTALNEPAKKYLKSIEDLPNSHTAKQFVIKRRIPSKYWSQLYYTEDYRKFINKYCDETKFKKILTRDTDPRLVIPFHDKDGNEFAWQGRTLLTGKEPRYITINPKENDDLTIFGMDRVDESKPIYVVEGPLDSLFLKNCIAVAGAGLTKAKGDVYIFDNEPRNKVLCKLIEKMIISNKKVVIFPKDLTYKDINDIVLSGMKKSDLYKLINDNTFQGIEARIRFTDWKKC